MKFVLLIAPCLLALAVPLYNTLTPELYGVPFFYWYQMAWTLLGAACTLPVYLHEERTQQTGAGK